MPKLSWQSSLNFLCLLPFTYIYISPYLRFAFFDKLDHGSFLPRTFAILVYL